MILDDNLILFEGPVTGAATGPAVALTSLEIPGRHDLRMAYKATEDFNNVTSLTLKLTESDHEDGTYTDIPGGSITVPLASLKVGEPFGLGSIPAGATKPWFKLTVMPTGTAPTTGKLFVAFVTYEDLPYVPQLYINAGRRA